MHPFIAYAQAPLDGVKDLGVVNKGKLVLRIGKKSITYMGKISIFWARMEKSMLKSNLMTCFHLSLVALSCLMWHSLQRVSQLNSKKYLKSLESLVTNGGRFHR